MAPLKGSKQKRTNGGFGKARRTILQCLSGIALLALAFCYWKYILPNACVPLLPFDAKSKIPDVADHLIEQYKIYIADLGTYETLLASTQTFYLTLITALISVLAFKETIRPIKDYAHPVSILVFFFIAVICVIWSATAVLIKDVFAAKFSIIKEMETTIPGLYPMFTNQRSHYVCNAGPLNSVTYLQICLVMLIGVAAVVFAGFGIRSMRRSSSS